jgi:hypothetical protein
MIARTLLNEYIFSNLGVLDEASSRWNGIVSWSRWRSLLMVATKTTMTMTGASFQSLCEDGKD